MAPPKVTQDYKTFNNDEAQTLLDSKSIDNLSEFDEVLDIVGSYGKYQKWLLYIFLCPFFFFLPLCFMNTVFLFSEPEHWCHLPRTESSWPPRKDLWLPREIGANGRLRYSECFMYVSPTNHSRVPCLYGWDYDHTNFEATITSDFNWVCDKENYVTQALTAANLGGGPGALVIGWAGDRFGRKPCFFLACIILSFCKVVSLFVPQYFTLFLILQVVMGTAYPAVIFVSIQLVMECVGSERRAWVSGCRFTAWVLGMSILPLVAMTTRHWLSLGLLTSLPLFFTLLTYSFVRESPRWLVSQGKLIEAETALLKISEINGTLKRLECIDLFGVLVTVKGVQEEKHGGKRPRHGIFTIFATWRLGRNTVLVCLSIAISYMLLYGINYNATSLPGNQFLNYFLLSINELPAGWVGSNVAQKMGRRWAQTLLFGLDVVAFGFAIVALQFEEFPTLLLSSLVFAKFCAGATTVIAPLQATELLPTSLRTNGLGMVSAAVGLSAALVPCILYMRHIQTVIPFVVFGMLALLGMLVSSFIPETLGTHLPETVDDASQIGAGTKFWSFLPHGNGYANIHTHYSKKLSSDMCQGHPSSLSNTPQTEIF